MHFLTVDYMVANHGYERADFAHERPTSFGFSQRASHDIDRDLRDEVGHANHYQIAPESRREHLSPRQSRKLARFKNARLCHNNAAGRVMVVLDEHARRFE